jgi:hypothetical protein
MIPEDVRDLLEEMVRKRIAGAECFIQLSFEAFAALASQGIVRGTKLKPFCEGPCGGAVMPLCATSSVSTISAETSAAVPHAFFEGRPTSCNGRSYLFKVEFRRQWFSMRQCHRIVNPFV